MRSEFEGLRRQCGSRVTSGAIDRFNDLKAEWLV